MNGIHFLLHHQNATEAIREHNLNALIMSISVTIDDAKNTATITIIGSFDFSLFNEFRDAYTGLDKKYNRYIIDMKMVEYLDSAALGMLLSMRNSIELDSVIALEGANDFIKNILMISRFDKRFDIQ